MLWPTSSQNLPWPTSSQDLLWPTSSQDLYRVDACWKFLEPRAEYGVFVARAGGV